MDNGGFTVGQVREPQLNVFGHIKRLPGGFLTLEVLDHVLEIKLAHALDELGILDYFFLLLIISLFDHLIKTN